MATTGADMATPGADMATTGGHGYTRCGHGYNRCGHGYTRCGHGHNRRGHGNTRCGDGYTRCGDDCTRCGDGYTRCRHGNRRRSSRLGEHGSVALERFQKRTLESTVHAPCRIQLDNLPTRRTCLHFCSPKQTIATSIRHKPVPETHAAGPRSSGSP
eukprot:226354-Pyramimonas_sp.AAC.1